MPLSKETKIWIFLVVDAAFFLLEIVVGYAAHSLALVADSFHMLNDVLSLCVGLWAVKVAHERPSSNTFTYGWSRAETLGALVNGVFLVALCVSIALEAIQRFVEPTEVSNPELVLIVGCFGLAFNILGLFLFHDHGHSHDEDSGHDHGHDHLIIAEEGHGTAQPLASHNKIEAQDGNDPKLSHAATVVGDTAPDNGLDQRLGSGKNVEQPKDATRSTSITFAPSGVIAGDPKPPTLTKASPSINSRYRRSRGSSRGPEDFPIHPASFRNEIIAQANQSTEDIDNSSDFEWEDETGARIEEYEPSELSPLLKNKSSKSSSSQHSAHRSGTSKTNSFNHHDHKHTRPNEGGHGHGGHSHGDMNMKGIFLHVLGDALGNIGVILSALIIWKTTWSFRFYFDPLISLGITIIILCSAIPLCKATSKILLQATPQHISVDDIRDDIETLPGIKSCHHMHVWQLTPSKLIASLHVQVNFDFNGEGSARYMDLAKAMRSCLHGYGIHSSTIQPEFCLDPEHEHGAENKLESTMEHKTPPKDQNGVSGLDGTKRIGNGKARAPIKPPKDEGCGSGACLLECDDTCGSSNQCCKPGSGAGSGTVTPKTKD